MVVAIVVALGACTGGNPRSHSAPRPPPAGSAAKSPSALVNPFMGTGVGGTAVGHIDDSPAADVPFGMMQWGPDTTPDRASGGGYEFGDTAISGFSLTHLNGPGCPALGDIPILPTIGTVGAAPESTTAGFEHQNERAEPGAYSVALGDPAVKTALAVNTRAGVGSFTFPASASANLLFKVADSAVPAMHAHTEIVGDREISGTVVSGQFCDIPGTYTLSFDAQFDRPFRAFSTWTGTTITPARRTGDGPHSGATITFDTRSDRTVRMKIGISFVSVANARANLAAETPSFDVASVARAATKRWDAMLNRIRVGGGTGAGQQTFYSALYRSLLHPNVFSDENGQYPGFDGRTHTAVGYTQYANFSGWDIYRSEVPLLAMIAAPETSAMMRSLLADDAQGDRLPKWAFTDVETGEINGDSADPILAEAYAFGARDFDARAALSAMVKGATTVGTGFGWDVARQDLDEYLKQGWVQVDRRDKTSFDYTIGGSETLEYAIDDDAIARLADALGEHQIAATFLARAGNWRNLVNPATHWLAARSATGAFPPGPAFQVSPLPGIGQDGWEEGNSIQYSWSVPQDLRGLFDAMGGNRTVVARLDAFFTHLNTSRKESFDWAGDEPALGIPWEYDYAGAPFRTQDVVRRIATQLYSATPNGEPGNDDLGAMSSWYVWAAIGMYPETPGSADLVLASPLFPSVSVSLSSGKRISISAPAATAASRYVQQLRVTGLDAPPACASKGSELYTCPWIPGSVVQSGAALQFGLSGTPNSKWGTAPAAAPPSITKG